MRISEERIESTKRIAKLRNAITEGAHKEGWDDDLTYLEVITAYNEAMSWWVSKALSAEIREKDGEEG